MVTTEHMLELAAQHAIKSLGILETQTLVIGRIGDEVAMLRNLGDVGQVAPLEFDIFHHSCSLRIGTADGDGFTIDV